MVRKKSGQVKAVTFHPTTSEHIGKGKLTTISTPHGHLSGTQSLKPTEANDGRSGWNLGDGCD